MVVRALSRRLLLVMLGDRGGVAIIMLVGFIGLAVPTASAAVITAGQLARNSQVYNNRLDRMYCNGGAIEHAIWRIQYEAGFVDSLTDQDPFNYTLSRCGVTLQMTVIKQPESSTGLGMGTVDYTVQAGHEIEIHVTTQSPSDDDMWIAYDTVDAPSWVKLPSPEHGDRTYTLHNNPSPPVGDTSSQHPLPMDETTPTATTLYNYDTDRDSAEGLLVQKNNQPCTETDPVKYQNWRTSPLAADYHIDGAVEFNIWPAMKDYATDKIGVFTVCIRDKNGGIYTDIVSTTVTLDPEDFEPGAFVSLGGTYDLEAAGPDSTTQARITIILGNVEIASIQTQ